jgi:exonuclease VII large subunit
MPEEKYDVLEGMVEKLDEMEEKLNEQIEKNIRLNQRLSESVSERILDEVSDGLAITQKEKLATLAESVEFEGERSYKEKLTTLRESYFPTKRVGKQTETQILTEDFEYSPEVTSDLMHQHLMVAELFRNY